MATHRKHDETTLRHDAGPAPPKLFAFWQGGSIHAQLPTNGSIVVGRSSSCDVSVDDRSLSRQHVRIHVGEGGASISVEDLGSANGTRVSGRALSPDVPVALRPGDVVEAGAVSLVVSVGRAPAEPAASASASPVMVRLQRLVELAAPSDIPVLVRGETGAGKELVASSIHRLSPRASGPFVTLNCAALPEPLLESELFGHEKGAFTGATQTKLGVVEAADGGTLFLDEVGELTATAQAKLLRVLERREVTRVGGTTPLAVDVRFVAATHRDLEEMVASGVFRQDLFFRLDGFSLVVPPLRERREEIASLARAFAAAACARTGRAAVALSPAALAKLEQHRWPGNVRELRNVVERAVILAERGTIAPEHVVLGAASSGAGVPSAPPSSSRQAPTLPPSSSGTLRDEISEIERRRILDALERCAGNQTRAAAELGMSRRTFLARLDAYGVKRPRRDR